MAVLTALSVLPVSAENTGSSPALDSLLAEAVQNNPEIKSLERHIEALEQRPSQARSLDDPLLKFAVANLPVDSFSFGQEAMTQKQIQVMQKFPFPGTLDLKGTIAEKDLSVAKAELDEKKNSVIRQVRVLYNTLLFLDRTLMITKDSRDLLSEVITTAETRYAAGKGGQREIVKARMELSGLIQKILLLTQQREAAAARFNTLLNRPVGNELTVTGEIEPELITYSLDELISIAEETRPALKGMKEKVEQSRLAIDLAEREYYPGMDIGISYGQRDDSDLTERPDFISASVTFNIPLWYKTKERRKVSEKKADHGKTEEQLVSLRNGIHSRIRELTSQIEMKEQEIELFKTGFIPQSTVSFESTMSGYRVNSVDFLTLINNLITLYNYKIQYYRTLTDYQNSLAELEEVIGRRLL
jgi:cobalt-zinc-cadmium efflux system outer membrane protein